MDTLIDFFFGTEQASEEPPSFSLTTTDRINDILAKNPSRSATTHLTHLQARLEYQTSSLPRPLLLSHLSSHQRVRFVHISDTHTLHRQMELPPGDVLVHTGDLMKNLGINFWNLERQYADVVRWLWEVAGRYELVLIVPGNHDSVLEERLKEMEKRSSGRRRRGDDNSDNDEDEAIVFEEFDASQIKNDDNLTTPSSFPAPSLPSNVKILSGEGVIYKGLKIWGEPHLTSRQEVLHKKYFSSAFELHSSQRKPLLARIPPSLDLLLTHSPPIGGWLVSGEGDEELRRRMDELRQRGEAPLFHCFGHCHSLGVGWWEGRGRGTVWMNAAQELVLGLGKKVTGVPWVFDIGCEEEDEECPLLY